MISRHNQIQSAYRGLGKGATFYGGMITCSILPGRAVCGAVWNMNREKNTRYLLYEFSPLSRFRELFASLHKVLRPGGRVV